MTLVGYARVSTAGQELDLQLDQLRAAGCEEIFQDVASGARTSRPGLDACLDSLQPGDTLVVWRLDRLGRSLPHLVELVSSLKLREVGFRSLRDGMLDTTTASGELVFHIFAALAQFERSLIQERTRAGLEAARARGRTGGRPKLDPKDPRVISAKTLHAQGIDIADICSTLHISRATLYRWLKL